MFKFENVVRIGDLEVSSFKKKIKNQQKSAEIGSSNPYVVSIYNNGNKEKISFEYNSCECTNTLSYGGLLSAISFYLAGVVHNNTLLPVLSMSHENIKKLLHAVDTEYSLHTLCMSLEYSELI